jgi:hypothetical protein
VREVTQTSGVLKQAAVPATHRAWRRKVQSQAAQTSDWERFRQGHRAAQLVARVFLWVVEPGVVRRVRLRELREALKCRQAGAAAWR